MKEKNKMEKLYDISEVCSLLGTTSRTLRYYEQEGLVCSTVIFPSQRRKYTQEQFDIIKSILALRALGLPIKAIKNLTSEKESLKEAIVLHRAELVKLTVEKQTQINLLEEVLHGIDTEKSYNISTKSTIECTQNQIEIAEICTDHAIDGEFSMIEEHFSDDLKILLPESALAYSFEIAAGPLGKLICREKPYRDEHQPNVVVCPLKYDKMTLRLKYVFHGDVIYGLWTDYIE